MRLYLPSLFVSHNFDWHTSAASYEGKKRKNKLKEEEFAPYTEGEPLLRLRQPKISYFFFKITSESLLQYILMLIIRLLSLITIPLPNTYLKHEAVLAVPVPHPQVRLAALHILPRGQQIDVVRLLNVLGTVGRHHRADLISCYGFLRLQRQE